MTTKIILISRFVYIAICIIFTISIIHSLKKTRVKDSRFVRKNNKNHYNFRIQRICVYILHTILYGSMFLHYRDYKILILYIAQMVYFIVLQLIIDIYYDEFNKTLMFLMFFMLSLGFSLNTRLAFDKSIKQFIICIIATVISFLVPVIMDKSRKIRAFYFIFGLIGIAALLLVYFNADVTYGAKMFLDLGFISVQPTEFVKISFVIFMSGILYKYDGFKAIFISGIVLIAHISILILCNDLGTSMILFVVYLFMISIVSGRIILLFAGLILGGLSGAIAYSVLDHVKNRVAAWLDPWSIIDGAGYQITQSLFSIHSGGFFGTGFTLGTPNSIPIVEQDFIFSAICEELGAIVGIIVLILSVCIVYIAMSIAIGCKDTFYKYTTIGLAITYSFQIFLTVGGSIKLIPSTGVTYPLLSNGGSSLFATIIVFCILQGVKINEKIDD